MYFKKYLLLLLFIAPCILNAQISREKQAIIQKAFPTAYNGTGTLKDTLGDVWNEFGDLFLKKWKIILVTYIYSNHRSYYYLL